METLVIVSLFVVGLGAWLYSAFSHKRGDE
jgi:hypothetical protein